MDHAIPIYYWNKFISPWKTNLYIYLASIYLVQEEIYRYVFLKMTKSDLVIHVSHKLFFSEFSELSKKKPLKYYQ